MTVTNIGSDQGQLEPMLDDLERRTGRLPKEYLVDGGFVKKEALDGAAARSVRVYAPVLTPRVEGIDAYARKKGDSTPPVAAWRRRMRTPRAKEIYKLRASTSETVNADLRCWRGIDRLNVRGLMKVTCVSIWAALTDNILQWIECPTLMPIMRQGVVHKET